MPSRIPVVLSVASALTLNVTPVRAQHAQPVFQTEVVVTAERDDTPRERIPASTAVLTAAEVRQRPAATLADVVQMLPGFQIVSSDAAGLAPSSIARGFFGGGEAEYVTLLVDGVPSGDVESGVVEWRRLPSFVIERVEALRGPASALYGDTALGGVVQVFTSTAAQRALRLHGSGGSFATSAAGVDMAQPLGAVTLHVRGSFDRSNGFRSQSERREGFGAISVVRNGGPRRWTARGSIHTVDREEPGALSRTQLDLDRELSDPLFRFDRDIARRGTGAFRYESVAGRWTYSVLAHASARAGERRRTLLLAPGMGDRADRDIATATAGLSFENGFDYRLARAPATLRFGADLDGNALETTYRPVSGAGIADAVSGFAEGHRRRAAAYATQSVQLGTRATVQAGIRWDHLRDRMSADSTATHRAWSPRVGGTFDLGSGVTLFAQAARAFKAPTLHQLFDPRPFPDFRGGTFLVSSPTLRPQRGRSGEGGVRHVIGRHRWEAVVYRMQLRDEIDFDPATFTYGNIGRSTHDGIELHAALFRGALVSAGVGYAWTRVVPGGTDAAPRQLKNIPRHLFRPDVTIMLPGRTTLYARYTRTAGVYADDANAVPLNPRSTADLRVAKTFSRLVATLDLLNVTNDEYEEVGYVLPDFRGGSMPFYYPAPGFAARAGIVWTF